MNMMGISSVVLRMQRSFDGSLFATSRPPFVWVIAILKSPANKLKYRASVTNSDMIICLIKHSFDLSMR